MASNKEPLPLSPPEDRTLTLPRPIVFALLLALYSLCYLLIPYWNLPEKLWQRQAMAVITAAAGLLWAYGASGTVQLRISRQGLWGLLAALVVLAAANYLPITSDLSWRGDEDHHFKSSYMMGGVLAQMWFPLILLALPLIVMIVKRPAASPAMRPVLLAVGAATIAAALLVSWQFPPKMEISPATYPLLVPTLASLPVRMLAPLYSSPYPAEWVFRVVPLMGAVILAWHCSRQALAAGGKASLAASALMALAVGTVPVVYYYSSILYLEMPAIVCMTIVCFGAKNLLTARAEEVVRDPRWYALILMGFLKDTMVAYLGAFMLCRLGVRAVAIARGDRRLAALLGEIRVGFCAVAPYVTYAVYRIFFSTVGRKYAPSFSAFFDGQTYDILASAFTTEYGLLGVLFLVGLVVLWVQRKRLEVLLVGVSFGVWAVMHITDIPDVLGYSRFMLYFMPMMAVAASHAVGAAWRKAPVGTLAGLAVWAGLNLLLSPFHIDGSKLAAWGQYRSDTHAYSMGGWQQEIEAKRLYRVYRLDWTEHSYPYRSAIRYVQEKYPQDRTLLLGAYYQYWQQYYTGETDRFRRWPVFELSRRDLNESVAASLMLEKACEAGVQHVLYHVLGDATPRPPVTYGFELEKVFQNDAHQIVLYTSTAGRSQPTGAPGD